MASSSVKPFHIKRWEGSLSEQDDLVVTEEPFEIRVGYGPSRSREQSSVAVTMRTPGNDFELALGFLFTEGIIDNYEDVESIKYCADVDKEEERENVVRIELKDWVVFDSKLLSRNFYTNSSCGVCGKSSIESIETNCEPISAETLSLSVDQISKLPALLNDLQLVFSRTGGLHASAVFDDRLNTVFVREDVGRHNALDKVIGAALGKEVVPMSDNVLLLSGRISFELVQKAARAGLPIIVGIGSPSTLAIETAKRFNITLIGFAKSDRFNIYCGFERVVEH